MADGEWRIADGRRLMVCDNGGWKGAFQSYQYQSTPTRRVTTPSVNVADVVASNTQDWDAEGRPTLEVRWGTP